MSTVIQDITRVKNEIADLEDRLRRETGASPPIDPHSLDYWVFMRDGVRQPVVDPTRKRHEWCSGRKVGKVVLPTSAVSSDAEVIVLFDGKYHLLQDSSRCIRRLLTIRRHGRRIRPVWRGPISRLVEALPRIRNGRDASPCKFCINGQVKDFKYGGGKRGRPSREQDEARRRLQDWLAREAQHEQEEHRFRADGEFDARARRGRRMVLEQRATVQVKPSAVAHFGDISDDHFEGVL